MNTKTEQKNVCARLGKSDREKLSVILTTYHRSIKGQLEAWIETEMRIIAREAK